MNLLRNRVTANLLTLCIGLSAATFANAQGVDIDALRQELNTSWGVKNWPAAEATSRKIVAHPKAKLSDQRNLIILLRMQGRNAETLPIRQTLAASAEANSGDLNGLCWLLLESNKPRDARPYCERAVSLDESSWAAQVNAGHSYLLAGDSTAAQVWYRKAMGRVRDEKDLKEGPIADFDLFIKNGWQVTTAQASKQWFEQAWGQLVPLRSLYRESSNGDKTKGHEADYRNRLEQALRQSIELLGADGIFSRQLASRYLRASLALARSQPEQMAGLLDYSQRVVSPILGWDEVAEIYAGNASSWMGGGAPQLANLLFTRATELAPNNTKVVMFRGGAKADIKDYQGAMADYTRAMELNPKDAVAVRQRGVAKAEIKDYQGAMADFTRAIELDPKDAQAVRLRGDVKLALEDYQGAMADYTRAMELDPKDAIAVRDRGLAKKALNDYQGAMADYSRAIELDPKDAIAVRRRGDAKAKIKDYQGAMADYTRAMELDPKDAIAVRDRGLAKEALKDYQGAIADFTRAMELDPKDATAVTYRGLAKTALKDYQGAIADFTRAMELDPKDGFSVLLRGDAKEKLKDFLGATKDYELAFSLGSKLIDRVLVATAILEWCQSGVAPPQAVKLANKAVADIQLWATMPEYAVEIQRFRSNGQFYSLTSVPKQIKEQCR